MKTKAITSIKLPASVASCLLKAELGMRRLRIDEFLSRDLYDPSMHLLKKKGKLLRPGLIFVGAYVLGERPSHFVNLAIAAELLHVSSLIHDDIIDGDMKRRDAAAVHVKYGQEAAILAGDALISKAIALSSEYGAKVMQAITRSTMEMCAGETIDYGYQKRKKVPNVREYTNIAALKSASLIGTCCNIAAVYKGSPLAGRMYNMGRDLGIAFQIRDDILDYAAHGKGSSGDGFRPNIVTTIMRQSDMGHTSALTRAIRLNNFYIDRAINRMDAGRIRSTMADYAGFIRVDPAAILKQ